MARNLEFDIDRHRQDESFAFGPIIAGPTATTLRCDLMDDRDKIVAVGLLSVRDLERLGSGFTHAYPVADADSFADVLAQLDAIAWPPGDRD